MGVSCLFESYCVWLGVTENLYTADTVVCVRGVSKKTVQLPELVGKVCVWCVSKKAVQLPGLVGKVCVWCVYEKPVQSSLALVGVPHIS